MTALPRAKFRGVSKGGQKAKRRAASVHRRPVAGLLLRIAVSLMVLLVWSGLAQRLHAQGDGAKSATAIRQLPWGELREARDARDRADLLAASFQNRYRWSGVPDGKASAPTPASAAAQEECQAVVEAYQRVAEKYPNTEVAAYAMLRLSGFHQYRREDELAIRTAAEVAKEYSGSFYGSRACFVAGMVELQSRHDPQAAIDWMKKIRRPPQVVEYENGKPLPVMDQNTQLYISAQQQIARAESMLGRGVLAQARVERIGERYPQYRQYAKQRLARDQQAYIESEFKVDIDAVRKGSVSTISASRHNGSGSALRSPRSAEVDTVNTADPPAVRTAAEGGAGASKSTAASGFPAKEDSSLGFLVGLGMCILGICLMVVGSRASRSRRKELQHAK